MLSDAIQSISQHGIVMSKPPVHITNVEERPGALLLTWAEVRGQTYYAVREEWLNTSWFQAFGIVLLRVMYKSKKCLVVYCTMFVDRIH